jgi:hypothetical protein
VSRDDGYEGLIDWAAAGSDGEPPVLALDLPAPVEPDRFVVPRRPFLLARGIQRRFSRDYPYLDPALAPERALGEPALFRAETVPALADEQQFASTMATLTDEHYEQVVLPTSRVPGPNVIVLAALLLQELLDPMEVLGWIGRDIRSLPRPGLPNRPENIKKLPKPGPAKYMIFSDTHRGHAPRAAAGCGVPDLVLQGEPRATAVRSRPKQSPWRLRPSTSSRGEEATVRLSVETPDALTPGKSFTATIVVGEAQAARMPVRLTVAQRKRPARAGSGSRRGSARSSPARAVR